MFLHEMVYTFLAGLNFQGYSLKFFVIQKIIKGAPINFWPKLFPGGNAVQILSNFPAKRLSIYRRKSLVTPLIG